MPALVLTKAFLQAIAIPVIVQHPRAHALGNGHSLVCGTTVDHNDLISPLNAAGDSPANPLFFVLGDNEYGKWNALFISTTICGRCPLLGSLFCNADDFALAGDTGPQTLGFSAIILSLLPPTHSEIRSI